MKPKATRCPHCYCVAAEIICHLCKRYKGHGYVSNKSGNVWYVHGEKGWSEKEFASDKLAEQYADTNGITFVPRLYHQKGTPS